MTATAAIYCRVSTSVQREEGTSLDTQLRACQEHAERLGYAVPPELVFLEDWPGTRLDRPKLDRLRQLATEGAFAAVVAYATDRLSRKALDFGVIADELHRRDIRLELVTEPVDGSREGQLLQYVRGWAAEFEHAKIVERMSRGRREAARRGRLPTGTTLYGYNYVRRSTGTPARCEIEPEQAEVVRTIFRWYTEEGLTQGRIAIRLTDMRVPPPTHGAGSKQKGGDRWHVSTIKRILSNSSYAGLAEAFKWVSVPAINVDPNQRRRYKNTRKQPTPAEQRLAISSAIPAIISTETWQAAVRTRDRNRNGIRTGSPETRKRDYLLVGHVVCAWCRRRYAGSASRNWLFYYCAGSKGTDRDRRCRNKLVSAKTLEADVWNRVEAALLDPRIIAAELERQRTDSNATAGLATDLERVDAALQRLATQERRLLKLYTMGEFDEALLADESATLRRQRDRLVRERSALNEKVDQATRAAQHAHTIAAYCERVRGRIERMGPEWRRIAIEALGINVTCDGGEWRVRAHLPIDPGSPLPTPRS